MNHLEQLLWNIRGEAARLAAEEYDGTFDALFMPFLGWTFAAVIAYVIVGSLTLELVVAPAGVVVILALLLLNLLLFRVAVTVTLASKYYVSEWTADVRPLGGIR